MDETELLSVRKRILEKGPFRVDLEGEKGERSNGSGWMIGIPTTGDSAFVLMKSVALAHIHRPTMCWPRQTDRR